MVNGNPCSQLHHSRVPSCRFTFRKAYKSVRCLLIRLERKRRELPKGRKVQVQRGHRGSSPSEEQDPHRGHGHNA